MEVGIVQKNAGTVGPGLSLQGAAVGGALVNECEQGLKVGSESAALRRGGFRDAVEAGERVEAGGGDRPGNVGSTCAGNSDAV
jgi:hypothetical protein